MSKELAGMLEKLAAHLKRVAYLYPEAWQTLGEAITALRAEPVATVYVTKEGAISMHGSFEQIRKLRTMNEQELYAAPSREGCKHGTSFRYVCEQCDSESREEQRECNPAPMHGQSKTGLTGSHPGAPTLQRSEADESLNKAGASDKDGFKASQSSAGLPNRLESDHPTAEPARLSAEQITVWMLERGSPAEFYEGYGEWTTDANQAFKYHYKLAAENEARFLNERGHSVRVVEHIFISTPSAFELECADVDRIILALGLTVEQARTEGGNLQVRKILNHIAISSMTARDEGIEAAVRWLISERWFDDNGGEGTVIAMLRALKGASHD